MSEPQDDSIFAVLLASALAAPAPTLFNPKETDPMFEKFTDRSRRVISLATQEAQRQNHSHVGVQHVLLGLAKEGSGVAAHVLTNAVPDALWTKTKFADWNAKHQAVIGAIRRESEKLIPPGQASDGVTLGRLPLTPGCEEMVRTAQKVSINLKSKVVGTEHLLLALIRDEGSPAVRVLGALGVTPKAVEAATMELLGSDGVNTADRDVASAQPVALGKPIPYDVINACLQEQAEAAKDADDSPADAHEWDEWVAVMSQSKPDVGDWLDAHDKAGDDPTEVLHEVRGRHYTDAGLKAAVDAAVRVTSLVTSPQPIGADAGTIAAANAFLTDLFGGPADGGK